jgi:3,4-dihydroxy 2-butanone 4-phosphate synthase/GTP cyclohydrolase II
MPGDKARQNDADTCPAFSNIEEIIAEVRDGKMVIIVDDESRENEGDLVMAAARVRSEDINYMARYGRGLICLTLTRGRCGQLRLPLMVSETDEQQATNFTISIEAAEGVTTGISAYDRARTIRVAVGPDARPEDLRQPGHVFPLMSQPGGVLTRAGHTEAGCDLARLAGLEPAAVIVEIMNEDGTMARRPQLEKFAQQHGLKIGRIADLIRYRLEKEESVERISEQPIKTEFGRFRLVCYEDHVSRNVHMALVSVHIQDTLGDVVGIRNKRLGWPLRAAMKQIAAAGNGAVVILRYGESPRQFISAVSSLGQPLDEVSGRRGGAATVLRTYGTGAQILRDLGVTRMRVLSAPKQMHGISAFGLEIVEYVDHSE